MSEKTEQPTSRKLREARKKGEVHKSKDVIETAVFAALLVLLAFLVGQFTHELDAMFELFRTSLPTRRSGSEHSLRILNVTERSIYGVLVPLIVVTAGVAILAGYLQVKSVFSITPIQPKPERLNPATNLKNIFSSRTLITLGKTLLQVILVGGIVLIVTRGKLHDFLMGLHLSPAQILLLLSSTLLSLCMIVFGAYVFTAALDYGHQFYEFIKQQKMSKDEVRREYKDVEGDPHLKAQRKALHRSFSHEQAVKRANVVVTNPTHFAVALRYVRGNGELPVVVAKGTGEEARRIREAATRLGIPVVENKPLARSLYSQIAVDRFIGPDHITEVAKLFAVLPRVYSGVVNGRNLSVRGT
jgi:type III secretion YscU/HrpY family protein